MFAIPAEVPARADRAVGLPCALLGSAPATPAIAAINNPTTNAVAPRPRTLRPSDRRITPPPVYRSTSDTTPYSSNAVLPMTLRISTAPVHETDAEMRHPNRDRHGR